MKGKIAEIFDSIQGEGIYVGEKQLFVRFFGCNLSCKFCDTNLSAFIEYEPQELLEKLKLYPDNYHSISFTGGEPLLQKDFLKEILKLTKESGFKNYLETNGTLPDELKEVIDYLDIVAMDLKLPSSTSLRGFWEEHRRFLRIALKKEVFLKAVICRYTKEEDLRQVIGMIRRAEKKVPLVLQPNSFEDDSRLREEIEEWRRLCQKEDVSTWVMPQMHKAVGLK